MPEEINRLATDAICDLLWTPSPDGDEHLAREGVPAAKVERVGNIMIDSFELLKPKILAAGMPAKVGVAKGEYGVVTLHRPSNVDDAEQLAAIVGKLVALSRQLPLVFPVHPRTRQRLGEAGLSGAIRVLPPLGYLDFLGLMQSARVVLTDSGGIQEETTALRVPCLTMRESTERPITAEVGSNIVVGRDPARILGALDDVLGGRVRAARVPELWDGRAGERAAAAIVAFLEARRSQRA
jgi:UDP-N-acetylglucosamine 2-epimerase (non-hydrolysing)